MKYLFALILFIFIFANQAKALYDPVSLNNNKFGIHILEESDIEDASKLVNSQGGSWG